MNRDLLCGILSVLYIVICIVYLFLLEREKDVPILRKLPEKMLRPLRFIVYWFLLLTPSIVFLISECCGEYS